ncbi:MerR family transcriptional regulator [Streptomyces mirabilis]|uniref:MerR family transcriptional regulator n=1 Tax=Streptomyces mirabilis TaxID=68239 RepID=UPI00369EB321
MRYRSRTGLSGAPRRSRRTRSGLARNGRPRATRSAPAGSMSRAARVEPYAAGLHSAKIRQLLPCMRDQDGGPSAIATPRLVADLTAERDRIDRMIADLVRSRETLDEVIDAAGDA